MTRTNYFLWFLFFAGVFVFFHIDSLWSGSTDLEGHYKLAYRISEHWWFPHTHSDPSLGALGFYTRGAHTIAAIVGTFLNSIFLGMQVVALLSIAIIYLSILLLLNSMPRRISFVALFVFFILIVINLLLRLDLHGREIVGNYFYPQLVGEALLYLSLLFAIRIDHRFGELYTAIFLLPIMLFIARFHLIPALPILGIIGGISAIKMYTLYVDRGFNLYKFFLIAIIPVVSTAAIILDPAFSIMRETAKNNGALGLLYISYPIGILSLSLLVLITSVVLFRQWLKRKDNILAAKYFSIYGASTAALCVIQYILTFFDMGSPYAVKKYAFSLETILFIQLSVILSFIIVRSKTVVRSKQILMDSRKLPIRISYFIFLSILALFIPSSVVPIDRKAANVSDIVAMEKRLVSLSYNEIPDPSSGKSNIVIGLNGFPRVVDYLFSTAIEKTPWISAVSDIIFEKGLHAKSYSYIISSSDNPVYGSSGCGRKLPGNISIIDAQCFKQKQTDK